MIAVDTNILVYAHREDSRWHVPASSRVTELAEGRGPWAIPAPCLHEWLAIVTHHRIYDPPTPLEQALLFIQRILTSPSLVVLSEGSGYWQILDQLVRTANIAGPRIHDARIAALCVFHRADELWSADRDFGRFPQVRVRNPLIASG